MKLLLILFVLTCGNVAKANSDDILRVEQLLQNEQAMTPRMRTNLERRLVELKKKTCSPALSKEPAFNNNIVDLKSRTKSTSPPSKPVVNSSLVPATVVDEKISIVFDEQSVTATLLAQVGDNLYASGSFPHESFEGLFRLNASDYDLSQSMIPRIEQPRSVESRSSDVAGGTTQDYLEGLATSTKKRGIFAGKFGYTDLDALIENLSKGNSVTLVVHGHFSAKSVYDVRNGKREKVLSFKPEHQPTDKIDYALHAARLIKTYQNAKGETTSAQILLVDPRTGIPERKMVDERDIVGGVVMHHFANYAPTSN